jgi:hypothetical protein
MKDESATPEALRYSLLDLAVRHCDYLKTGTGVIQDPVETAKKFEAYITGTDVPPAAVRRAA